jgi:multicomponent Na+:H+ antiporter subunit F
VNGDTLLYYTCSVVLIMLGIGLLLGFARLVRGPSLADRVVAFDVMTLMVLGLVVTDTILTNEQAFVDAAIILALLTFVATIAFARHLELRAREGQRQEVPKDDS